MDPRQPMTLPSYVLAEEQAIEVLAAATHMANRAYCSALGDETQTVWATAPEWQRNSARAGVKGVLAGNGPEQSHQSWLAQKITDGWVYGPEKLPEQKIHNCLTPYSDLPLAQKRKDDHFVATVRQLAVLLGLPIASSR